MSQTIVVAAIFAVLLGLELRYRRRLLKVATALVAVAVLLYFQPDYTSARRRALGAPVTDRVTKSPVAGSEGDTLSDYHSGVYTTMRFIEGYATDGANARLIALGALVWLACSPVLRHAHGSAPARSPRPPNDTGAPEA